MKLANESGGGPTSETDVEEDGVAGDSRLGA